MSDDIVSFPFERWISQSFVGLLQMCISGAIYKMEQKKRKSDSVHFTTKYLRIWSFICIICGPINGFNWVLYFLNGICYVSPFVDMLTYHGQQVFMGFYQLSRLYYCFGQSQVYSRKGYSNWLFSLMFACGAMSLLMTVPVHGLWGKYLYSECGIDPKQAFAMYEKPIELVKYSIWPYIALYTFIWIWDVITLILYLWKIRSFKKKYALGHDNNVYQRIQCIMQRIVIVTLFYEWTHVTLITIATIYLFFSTYYSFLPQEWQFSIFYFIMQMSPIIYTYAMFIMMEHNDTQYKAFLKTLRRSKLYYVWCCCRHMVIDQLNELDDCDKDKDQKNIVVQMESTLYETHDISANHAAIQMREPAKSVTDVVSFN